MQKFLKRLGEWGIRVLAEAITREAVREMREMLRQLFDEFRH